MIFYHHPSKLRHFMPYAFMFGNAKTIAANHCTTGDDDMLAHFDFMIKRYICVKTGTFADLRKFANNTTGANYSISTNRNVIIYYTIFTYAGRRMDLAIFSN